MPNVEKVTQDQAAEALRIMSGAELPVESPAEEPSAPAEPEVAAPEPVTTKQEEPPAPVEAAPETDDVTSLKKRLEEIETREKERETKFDSRLKALQSRNAESERILRDRYLRKSTATDKALRVLKAAKSDTGVDPAEADRVIAELEGTMHPASATFVAPEPRAAGGEEPVLILNNFLNEKGMDTNEAETFGNWIRTEAVTVLSQPEQAVVNESLDGFLRIAHARWQQGLRETSKQTKTDDAVAAVKSVQRTQREAARAATAPSGAPKKQPTKPSDEVDVKKLTKADISALVRQSWEQYR